MIQSISSLQNPLVKHLVKLRESRSYRIQSQSTVVSGVKVVAEISRYFAPILLLVAEDHPIPEGIPPEKIYTVGKSILRKVSGLISPEGILAEMPLPPQDSLEKMHRILALDQIADPGNMGTLLRTALALGWEGAFILEKSVDLFNEKVLRASRGAPFLLPFRIGTAEELALLIEKNALVPLAADLDGVPISSIPVPEKPLLILGNEAHGVSRKWEGSAPKSRSPCSGQWSHSMWLSQEASSCTPLTLSFLFSR